MNIWYARYMEKVGRWISDNEDRSDIWDLRFRLARRMLI